MLALGSAAQHSMRVSLCRHMKSISMQPCAASPTQRHAGGYQRRACSTKRAYSMSASLAASRAAWEKGRSRALALSALK